ncbi:MAG: apolipoprotein N-acyltransferase [Gammaproteobacteria bacterium]
MRNLFGTLHPPSGLGPLTGQAAGRSGPTQRLAWFLVCGAAGWLQAASLAWPIRGGLVPGTAAGEPDGLLQVLSLAVLAMALRSSRSAGQAAWRCWLFATAWLSGTFWWLFISMHVYGGLAAPLAVMGVAALAGFLALYYALATGLMCRVAPRHSLAQALVFAAVWTLAELMRGRWLTGFPWGAGGYAHVDTLAGWAPWVGVYGMGTVAAMLAYGLALLPELASRWRRRAATGPLTAGDLMTLAGWTGVLVLVVVVARGPLASEQDTRTTGTMRVWLLQGNVPQDEKFVPGKGVALALDWYPQQLAQAVRPGGAAPDLVVAPETALPLLPQQLGADFWEPLLSVVDGDGQSRTATLLGLPLGSFEHGYTNSAWGITPDMARGREGFPGDRFYRYDKHHLVPFGEFIPPFLRWFTDLMHIPLGDFSRGAIVQRPWDWAGQRIAPNICYEDLFGEELAAGFVDAVSAPTVLVNLSNIGWFGDSVAIDQHLQISRLRALELGRPMVRATNTGATAVINHRGEISAALPRMVRDRLEADVEGRDGLTPYARWASRWGLMPLWGLCLSVVLAAAVARRGLRVRPHP